MKVPTAKQIKKEADKLAKMKPQVRRTTAFGDDNHEAIDAQIRVLDEDMNEDEIYGEWEGDENRLRDNALEARRWMDGESEDGTPSYGWKDLVTK